MLQRLFTITKENLTFVGWLSIVYAILTIPYLALILVAAFAQGQKAAFNPVSTIISLFYTGAYIYIYYFLKTFLNKKYNFFAADKSILWLIGLEAAFFLISELSIFFEQIAIAIFLLLIPMGITLIMLGVKLLSLKQDMYGLAKAFAYQTIASGVLFACVILFPLAIIPALIAQVILGIIFLRAATEIKQ